MDHSPFNLSVTKKCKMNNSYVDQFIYYSSLSDCRTIKCIVVHMLSHVTRHHLCRGDT